MKGGRKHQNQNNGTQQSETEEKHSHSALTYRSNFPVDTQRLQPHCNKSCHTTYNCHPPV